MKRYTDLSVEELEALTSEEIEKYIEIEVASAGIQMVTKPLPLEQMSEILQPTETAYECKGVIVGTLEEAQIIQGVKVLRTNYHGGNYDHRYLEERQHDADITIVKYYTKEAAAALKPKAEANKAAKQEYETANKIYCEYAQQIDGFQQEVLDVVGNARRVMNARRQAEAAHARYLELADGDAEIAAKFFRDAFRGQFDLLHHVLGDPLPGEAVEEAVYEAAQ